MDLYLLKYDRYDFCVNHSTDRGVAKASSFSGETTETKRPNSLMEPKTTEAAPKKSRLETRAICPPFKVQQDR
uniref:Uncharacterized protein n=1 Tax=Rhizophora mucronata TaxID=61149 RepID=A0A2P2Q828_RHIMU